MTSSDLLTDALGRIRGVVHEVLGGLSPEQLTYRPDGQANSIAWLIWHLTRIEDDHIAGAAQVSQVWTADGWAGRLGLPFDDDATGYGQHADEVAAVRVESGDLLADYHDAVYTEAVRYAQRLTDADLGRIVDERWDPPVTLGVRLISVISDGLQHAGQAAYVRGLAERR
jgi:uncharacterized damage-inducible protein DinB